MIRPIKNKVLVRLKPRVEESKGGIAIPKIAQEVEEWGVAVRVGGEVEHISGGDIVFVKSTQGTHYREGGEDFIVIEDFRVLCKIEG